jgi:hypothetical protein
MKDHNRGRGLFKRYLRPFLLPLVIAGVAGATIYYLSRPRMQITIQEERNDVVKMTEYGHKMNVTSIGYRTEEIVSPVPGGVQKVATTFFDLDADNDLDACTNTHFIDMPFGVNDVVLADTMYVLTRGGTKLAKRYYSSEDIVHVGKNDPMRKRLESGYASAENRWNGIKSYSL